MTNCLKVQGEIMRAVTICQGQSYSSAFVWLHLSSLHNSIQSCGCWQRLTRSPPTHSLQLLWMEKHRRTAEDRQERKCSFYKKALDLMSFSTLCHLPSVHRWMCLIAINKADDDKNKCIFKLVTFSTQVLIIHITIKWNQKI